MSEIEYYDFDKVRKVAGNVTKQTIYNMMAKNDFPQSIKLSPGSIRWLKSEVDEWEQNRIKARLLK